MSSIFSALAGDAGLLLKGLAITLPLTAIASTLVSPSASAGGDLTLGNAMGEVLVAAYVELIRNTPFFVQLLLCSYGLPSIGIKMTAIQVAIPGYDHQLDRLLHRNPPGGYRSGAARPAREDGLKPWASGRFPYSFTSSAAGGGQCLSGAGQPDRDHHAGSAVVSQIAVTDLTHVSEMIQSRSYRAFETSFVVTLIYLVMCLGLRWMLARAGRRLFAGRADEASAVIAPPLWDIPPVPAAGGALDSALLPNRVHMRRHSRGPCFCCLVMRGRAFGARFVAFYIELLHGDPASAVVPGFLRPAAARHRGVADPRRRRCTHALCRRVPGGNLARLCRRDSTRTVGSKARPSA